MTPVGPISRVPYGPGGNTPPRIRSPAPKGWPHRGLDDQCYVMCHHTPTTIIKQSVWSIRRRRKMRSKRLRWASGVTGFVLALMPSVGAHAGLWCPTPIPGMLMKYCLCESITGRAEVSSPTPLPPLRLFGLWRHLNETAMVDWVGRVQVRGGKRKFLSYRWTLACDRERDCSTTRTVAGSSVVYKYACYAKARPAPCFPSRYC